MHGKTLLIGHFVADESVDRIQRHSSNLFHATHMHGPSALYLISQNINYSTVSHFYGAIIDFCLGRFKSLKKKKKRLCLGCVPTLSQREEEALHHKIKSLTHPVLLIAADLQIICIDQSRDVTECRADSKILSI